MSHDVMAVLFGVLCAVVYGLGWLAGYYHGRIMERGSR